MLDEEQELRRIHELLSSYNAASWRPILVLDGYLDLFQREKKSPLKERLQAASAHYVRYASLVALHLKDLFAGLVLLREAGLPIRSFFEGDTGIPRYAVALEISRGALNASLKASDYLDSMCNGRCKLGAMIHDYPIKPARMKKRQDRERCQVMDHLWNRVWEELYTHGNFPTPLGTGAAPEGWREVDFILRKRESGRLVSFSWSNAKKIFTMVQPDPNTTESIKEECPPLDEDLLDESDEKRHGNAHRIPETGIEETGPLAHLPQSVEEVIEKMKEIGVPIYIEGTYNARILESRKR